MIPTPFLVQRLREASDILPPKEAELVSEAAERLNDLYTSTSYEERSVLKDWIAKLEKENEQLRDGNLKRIQQNGEHINKLESEIQDNQVEVIKWKSKLKEHEDTVAELEKEYLRHTLRLSRRIEELENITLQFEENIYNIAHRLVLDMPKDLDANQMVDLTLEAIAQGTQTQAGNLHTINFRLSQRIQELEKQITELKTQLP